jgi:hypothetical protein
MREIETLSGEDGGVSRVPQRGTPRLDTTRAIAAVYYEM